MNPHSKNQLSYYKEFVHVFNSSTVVTIYNGTTIYRSVTAHMIEFYSVQSYITLS